MFERFHRVKHTRARTHEGTGIGLALVQELARLHGGGVTVESEEDRGTTFTVTIRTGTVHLPSERIAGDRQLASTSVGTIPYVEEMLRWLPASTTEAPWPSPEISRTSTELETAPQVLIADDNADMREYLGRILGQTLSCRRRRRRPVPRWTGFVAALRISCCPT